MRAIRAYKFQQTETASRERIMVLLLEGALSRIRLAITALEKNENAPAQEALARATEIISVLLGALDRSIAPELCDKLTDLYTFVNSRLLASAGNLDPQAAKEAERVFSPLVDGFRGAVEKVMAEKASQDEPMAVAG